MAEILILGVAGLSIVVLLAALIVLLVCWKRAFCGDAKWLLVALLSISTLHGISNFAEWASIDHPVEPLEDYFLLVLPALWGCFFYIFLREQTREELGQSEARYRSLTDDVLDTTSAGISILDALGHVVWVNQAVEHYFGLKRNEIVGRDYTRLIEDRLKHMVEDSEGWAAEMLAVWDRDDVVGTECHIFPGAARQERWLECRVQPIRSGLYAGGRIEHFYDITERKRASEQREELLEVLETQKSELERFVYTVSHDLKSPLITIHGFLGILRENLESGAVGDAREDLKRIEKAAGRMERLLEELLDLARIGRDEDSTERVGLADVIAEGLEMVHAVVERHGVMVIVHDGLPFVWGHRARLVEVYQNLIDNAVKYVDDRTKPRIEIGAEQRHHDVLCFVRDNGVGIDSRYSGRIFDLFEQLDPTKDGTGIGLAIVKRIVETHGGRIWVESEGSGHGSTFWFTLAGPNGSRRGATSDLQSSSTEKNEPD